MIGVQKPIDGGCQHGSGHVQENNILDGCGIIDSQSAATGGTVAAFQHEADSCML